MDEALNQAVTVPLGERMKWDARVTITVARTDSPMDPPANVWVWDFDTARFNTTDLRDEVESIAIDLRAPYSITARSGRTSWGADSGEIVAVILFLSGQITQAIIDQKVSDLFVRLRQRRAERQADAYRPLERSEAIARARWAVGRRYADLVPDLAIDGESLQVIKERHELDTDTWVITFRGNGAWAFDVALRLREGLVVIDRIDAKHRD